MGNARRRARKDVDAAALPQEQGIRRDRRGARRQYRQGRRANKAAYGALDNALQGIGKDYKQQYRQLNTGLQQGMQALGGMAGFGGGVEGMTSAGGFGTIGASAVRGLGQQRQRGVENITSMRKQGGIEQMTNQQNMLADFQNTLDELRQRQQDIDAQKQANMQSLIPQYRQQGFENRMSRRSMSMQEEQWAAEQDRIAREAEFSDWYRRQLMGQMNGGGGQNNGGQAQKGSTGNANPGWGWEGAGAQQMSAQQPQQPGMDRLPSQRMSGYNPLQSPQGGQQFGGAAPTVPSASPSAPMGQTPQQQAMFLMTQLQRTTDPMMKQQLMQQIQQLQGMGGF